MTWTAILTSDIHLRDDQPLCRTDNYQQAQEEKIAFLCAFQRKTKLTILDAGDIFHRWKSSPGLESWAIRTFSGNVITIPGNHDLPSHNINLFNKSSLSVLDAASSVFVIKDNTPICLNHPAPCVVMIHGFPWGVEPEPHKEGKVEGIYHVALIHALVCEDKTQQITNVPMKNARQLLKKLNYELIVTGDNHKSFTVFEDNKILVNPGAMMRMSADNLDATPCFYLWSVVENKVRAFFYPIKHGVIEQKHIQEEQKRNERLEAFIKGMQDNYEITLNFERNLQGFMDNNKVRKPVKEIIWGALG